MGRKCKISGTDSEYAVDARDREELLRQLRCAIQAEMGTISPMTEPESAADLLWKVLLQYQKEPFYTVKGLEFTYYIKGNELFVSRKDKSITRASVEVALQKAMNLNLVVSGPKKLTSFGASYLYPIFLKLEIIRAQA